MEHESFENDQVAEVMNNFFVCIKVDREERPDIDQIYMDAVQAMTGSGGWPLTVFLLPNAEPFFGGTYFPDEDRFGRPGFPLSAPNARRRPALSQNMRTAEMNTLDALDADSLRDDIPDFRPGDTVKVHVRVVEGNRSRIQVFQGVVIRRQGGGIRETFTVRKVSFGVGVERTFPVHTPVVEKIEVVTRGDVRRAKLYYLRELRGKAAKIKEKRDIISR